jgi:hypothetical protein
MVPGINHSYKIIKSVSNLDETERFPEHFCDTRPAPAGRPSGLRREPPGRYKMEKRERKRYNCRAPIVCGRFNSKEAHSAEIVNYSSDGMCIKCDSGFKEKSTIVFRVNGRPRTAAKKAKAGLRTISLAEVRWMKAAGQKNERPFYLGLKLY